MIRLAVALLLSGCAGAVLSPAQENLRQHLYDDCAKPYREKERWPDRQVAYPDYRTLCHKAAYKKALETRI